jgi:putative holliday junction resolvase
MRILGIDYGDRNVGLALSDPLLLTAQPLGQYILRGESENRKYFCALVRQHEVGRIVIGFPLRMDGSAGSRAQKTQEFAAWLGTASGLPVELWDERLTTQQAVGIMQEQRVRSRDKKRVEHQISASIILQGYLDHRRFQGHAP